MKVAIGSDHAGCRFKPEIADDLWKLGHEVTVFVTDSVEPLDYPLFNRPVAGAVIEVWMATAFEGGRHRRRLELIDAD
jgi:ribose 5-phosphate isomerase RpiB